MPGQNPTAAATNRLGMRYAVGGPPELQSMLNEHNRGFDYLFPQPSGDIIPEVTPNGTVYRFRNPQTTSGRATATSKWIPYIVSGAAKITIGNTADVEGIIPTIGGTSVITAPAPELTVVTGDVYFECTMDAAGTFTAVEIKSDASMPANTSTLRYRRLYTIAVSGTSVTITSQPVTTAVSHKLCGGLSTWGQA